MYLRWVRLYLLPAPLSRESPYWSYPLLGEVARSVPHFFVERIARVRGWLERLGLSGAARLWEWDAQLGDWPWEAYETVFSQRWEAALLTEAGLPGVADPGATLVRRAHAEGYAVFPLAGPSSVTLALAASGLSGQAFTFWGYPPIERRARRRFLEQVFRQAQSHTQILMETPARSAALLQNLVELGPPQLFLCVAHDLTGRGQFVQTRPIAQWRPMPLPKAPTLFLLGK